MHALVKTEEGERRNYKIDYQSLSVNHLIGAGASGFVYRGEHPLFLSLFSLLSSPSTATPYDCPREY